MHGRYKPTPLPTCTVWDHFMLSRDICHRCDKASELRQAQQCVVLVAHAFDTAWANLFSARRLAATSVMANGDLMQLADGAVDKPTHERTLCATRSYIFIVQTFCLV
eukprot:6190960-Pleurochrysis_carterae.AAC.2